MIRKLLFVAVLVSTGCVHLQPIGPFADELKRLPMSEPGVAAATSGGDASVPEPIIRTGPKPTPPAVYVAPSDVAAGTVADSIKRLTQELETDRRTMDAMPKYAEVSIVK